jgi:hypothetical protein
LETNSTNPQQFQGTSKLSAFNSNGFSLGTSWSSNNTTYVTWTFRKQPKFFDVVTYTGNSTGSQTQNIPHNLGSVPGCIIVKALTDNNWIVYHRNQPSSGGTEFNGVLNSTVAWDNYFAQTSSTIFRIGSSGVNSTTFTVGTQSSGAFAVNTSGVQYVAYVFAHNAGGFGLTGTDNVITCGSFTGTTTVDLGYEPQWLMFKRTNGAGNWRIVDNMRGWPVSGNPQELYPNLSQAESSNGGVNITSTGFSSVLGSGENYIYVAIRRGPMKVPTTGTSVYEPVAYIGNETNRIITAGFPVDTSIFGLRDFVTSGKMAVTSRLGGQTQLFTTQTGEESTATGLQTNPWDSMTGVNVSGNSGVTNNTSWSYIDWNFRRAPSFFDVVYYTGNGSTQTINHNLTVAPTFFFTKPRNQNNGWLVYSSTLGVSQYLSLQTNSAAQTFTWTQAPTSTTIGFLGGGGNNSGINYVAYLFASCPGVSSVGSFTGTGATQVINCGFTGGARFVLIKATSTTGNWLVWDSARGIVSGNDPYLAFNSTAAEVTGTDWVDTAASGFELSNAGGNLANSNGVSYIFLAVA